MCKSRRQHLLNFIRTATKCEPGNVPSQALPFYFRKCLQSWHAFQEAKNKISWLRDKTIGSDPELLCVSS